ncbi:Oxoglutarate/iron-dependent dioxygenase [Trema orientale]|uniref:Oxoglutarate/iron-dependent dioxygenase n=1 Tax=Trema orientale TaxID=63057 RepID=A0A2P5D065_TREOI|nr:Oxoglutarate/iron-dependent dioxygenase [Trema orientale]
MELNYDRASELKAFDDTKAGVKGLADSGITKVPRIFYEPQENPPPNSVSDETELSIPVVDLENVEEDSIRRQEIVNEVRVAAETRGFFQVVNHGVPQSVLEEMEAGVRRFYEQETEVKKEFYTRDPKRTVRYNSNFDLFRAPAANWRDTTYCVRAPTPPRPEELPVAFRDVLLEYSNQVMKLGISLFELLSEALGLNRNYLKHMDCAEGLAVLCHYSPACPEPELTMATSKHTDGDFLTVLLLDQIIGGLQVLHQNRWIDVRPIPGALVINIGDLLQLISNDRLRSVEHRVLANRKGPRVSVACFFRSDLQSSLRTYGPIKELLTEDDPRKYRETTIQNFIAHYNSKGLDGTSALSHFRL